MSSLLLTLQIADGVSHMPASTCSTYRCSNSFVSKKECTALRKENSEGLPSQPETLRQQQAQLTCAAQLQKRQRLAHRAACSTRICARIAPAMPLWVLGARNSHITPACKTPPAHRAENSAAYRIDAGCLPSHICTLALIPRWSLAVGGCLAVGVED